MPLPYTPTDRPDAWRCVALPCDRIGCAVHLRSHRAVQLCEITGTRPGQMEQCPRAADGPFHGDIVAVRALLEAGRRERGVV